MGEKLGDLRFSQMKRGDCNSGKPDPGEPDIEGRHIYIQLSKIMMRVKTKRNQIYINFIFEFIYELIKYIISEVIQNTHSTCFIRSIKTLGYCLVL
jgi:hypothetical protein